ncbi:hypothetical protein B0H11DRAFT_2426207 [Mycena galericulata]|nr:hypothetical protein B0H11DRAFT_2426207 [Mycena galericulata]
MPIQSADPRVFVLGKKATRRHAKATPKRASTRIMSVETTLSQPSTVTHSQNSKSLRLHPDAEVNQTITEPLDPETAEVLRIVRRPILEFGRLAGPGIRTAEQRTTHSANTRLAKEFLSAWDPNLLETIAQMETKMSYPENAAKLDRFLASFNLVALQRQATETMQKNCVGAIRRVFILPFDDGTDILVRLRIPGNGFEGAGDGSVVSDHDLAERFSSEIATLRFVARKTSIPVPELYHWDCDPSNPIGTRYMLMQRISAPPLIHVWRDVNAAGREKIVAQIARYEAELLDNPLPSIGILVDEHGTVGRLGPTCSAPFVLRSTHRGPFACSKDFLLALVDANLDLVANRTAQWTAWRSNWSTINGGVQALTPEYAEQWYQLLRDAIWKLLNELRFPPPIFRLAHTDFNEGNLLVSSAEDPTIVAVLDWEGAQVLPAWDTRYGCKFDWTLLSETEAKELRMLYSNITTENDRWPGTSLLHFQSLLSILDSLESILSDRKELDSLFLRWLAHAEKVGGEWCTSEPDGFRRLRKFIEDSQ